MELQTVQQGQVVAAQPEATTLIAVISRVATDPNCDLDKMERLLNMQERVMAKQAEQAFNAAMAAMQAEIPSIAERGTGHNIKYATLEDILDTVRPIMHKYGFAVSFRISQVDRVTVTGVLMHKDGHREETSMTLAADTSGSKNAVQAIGSSVSYGKRYVLCAMLNIATRGEDDNGYAATPHTPVTDTQAKQLKNLYDRMKPEDQERVFTMFGDVTELDRGQFDKAHAAMTNILKGYKNANPA
jgi:hypothetical protein